MKQEIKKEAIIQAAETRFTHFTVAKTTMSEIAQDLGISKASLYYYFPDKLGLYAAVVSNLIDRELEDENKTYLTGKDPLDNIIGLLQKRREFVAKYYSLIEFVKTAIEKAPDELKPVFKRAKETDINYLKSILRKGQEDRILNITDLDATTTLFVECLEGLRKVCLEQDGAIVFPQRDQFEGIFLKEIELATIFVRGLKC